MGHFDLAPGEVWEDRYDPQHEDTGSAQVPAVVLSDEELAELAPWF